MQATNNNREHSAVVSAVPYPVSIYRGKLESPPVHSTWTTCNQVLGESNKLRPSDIQNDVMVNFGSVRVSNELPKHMSSRRNSASYSDAIEDLPSKASCTESVQAPSTRRFSGWTVVSEEPITELVDAPVPAVEKRSPSIFYSIVNPPMRVTPSALSLRLFPHVKVDAGEEGSLVDDLLAAAANETIGSIAEGDSERYIEDCSKYEREYEAGRESRITQVTSHPRQYVADRDTRRLTASVVVNEHRSSGRHSGYSTGSQLSADAPHPWPIPEGGLPSWSARLVRRTNIPSRYALRDPDVYSCDWDVPLPVYRPKKNPVKRFFMRLIGCGKRMFN